MGNPKPTRAAQPAPKILHRVALYLRLAGLRIGSAVLMMLLVLSAGCWIALGRNSDGAPGVTRSTHLPEPAPARQTEDAAGGG